MARNKNQGARAAHGPSNVKAPRLAQAFPPGKLPRIEAANAVTQNDLRPVWALRNIRLAAPFGWANISRADMLDVMARLQSFESMTWNEILVAAKKQNHTLSSDQICKEARTCLEGDWQGADEVVSLRVSGKKRVWGIREGGILYLLWWDPTHSVCPTQKKNT